MVVIFIYLVIHYHVNNFFSFVVVNFILENLLEKTAICLVKITQYRRYFLKKKIDGRITQNLLRKTHEILRGGTLKNLQEKDFFGEN